MKGRPAALLPPANLLGRCEGCGRGGSLRPYGGGCLLCQFCTDREERDERSNDEQLREALAPRMTADQRSPGGEP